MYYNIIIDNIETFPDNIDAQEWELKLMLNVNKYIKKHPDSKRFFIDINDVYVTEIENISDEEKTRLNELYLISIAFESDDFIGEYFITIIPFSSSEDETDIIEEEEETLRISNITQYFNTTILTFFAGTAIAIFAGTLLAGNKY